MEGISPGGRPPVNGVGGSPVGRPPINFDAISDPATLKTLLRAQHEKLGALERRIQGQDGTGGGAPGSGKVETLEQLVVALRRKLQHRTDQVKLLVVRAKQRGEEVGGGILDGAGELVTASNGDVESSFAGGPSSNEAALQESLDQARAQIAELQRSHETVSRDLAVARSLTGTTTAADPTAVMQLEERCRLAEDKCRISQERITELRDGFARMSAEKRNVEERLNEMSAQQFANQVRSDEVLSLQVKISELEQALSIEKMEKNRQLATVQQRDETISALRQQVGKPTHASLAATEALKQQTEQLTAEKRQAWAANDELRLQNDRLTTERDSLKRHLDAKGKQFDDSDRIVREAQASVLKAQKELQKVIAERDALATSRGLAASSGDTSLKHENETLRKRLTQREAATREKMSEKDAAVNVAEQRRQAVQAQLDQARTENETLMADNTALHRDMMEAKAMLPAKTATIEDLQAKFDLAKHENTALTKRLQAAFADQAKYKDIEAAMSQQEQIKADLKAAISELTAKNAEALGTQEENQKSITNLQNRVSELTRDLHIRAKDIEGERSRAEKLAIALQDANERAKKYETGFTRAQFLEEEIKSKEIVIEDLRSRSDDVRRGAASKDDEMSELRAAVNKHVHTIKMLEGEISGLNFAAKGKDEALQKMHQSKLALQSELSESRSRAVSDVTVSASEAEKLRGECSRLKLQLQNAHQMIRDLEVQTDRQGGDDTQSLQRALAESKDEIRRRDLEVEAFKTSAQDLRTRLLAVSDENRSLIERMRGGGNGSSKEQEAHVAQLRQQLVSAAEINQAQSRKNAAMKERLRAMKELIARHSNNEELKRSVTESFDNWLESVDASKTSVPAKPDGHGGADDMDRLLVAALSAGQQQRASGRGSIGGAAQGPASNGARGGGRASEEYDWLYGMNSAAGAPASGGNDDVPEIVL